MIPNSNPYSKQFTRRTRSLRSDSKSPTKKHKSHDEQRQEPSLQLDYLGGNGTTPSIFLVKTYDMLTTCDESLAAWSDRGETFLVKNPDEFAAKVIPKYFDHSNFSSFARQLNFYGFKKIPVKPIRMDEGNREKSKYVKFHHVNFRQGRKDLLSKIIRSTRKSANSTAAGPSSGSSSKQEIQALKKKVASLEGQIAKMEASFLALEYQMMQHMSQMRRSYDGRQSTGMESTSNNMPAWPESRPTADTATLPPSPHVKEVDPSLLPPPPPQLPQRSSSLLRGFSNEFSTSEAQFCHDFLAVC